MGEWEKSALLVIDVQNYFINSHTRDLPGKIARHLEKNKYGAVAFSKFINGVGSNFARILGWNKCHSAPDTDIHPMLARFANKKNTFEKNTFSAFKNPALARFLKKHGIRRLFICGDDSEACVLSTVFEAFDLGYDVKVLKGLCASCNGKEYHDYAKRIIERNLEPMQAAGK